MVQLNELFLLLGGTSAASVVDSRSTAPGQARFQHIARSRAQHAPAEHTAFPCSQSVSRRVLTDETYAGFACSTV
jgi:hypothetical protein